MLDILSIIYDEPLSISEILRRLNSRGIKINRLVLTGYLKALEECGYIQQVKTKSSKNSKRYVYRKTPSILHQIKNAIKELEVDADKENEIVLYMMYRMFSRPILESELKLFGFKVPKSAIKVNLNENEEAYIPSKEYKEECIKVLSSLVEKVMQEASINEIGSY